MVAYVVRRARYVSRQRSAGLVEQVVNAPRPTEPQQALLDDVGARHVRILPGGDALFEAVLQSGTFLRQRFATATDLRAATANELRVNFEEYSGYYTGDDFWAEVEYIAQPGNPPRDGDGLVPRALAKAAAIDLAVLGDFGVGGQGTAVHATGSGRPVLVLQSGVLGGHYLATRDLSSEEPGEPAGAVAGERVVLSNWEATDDVIVEAIRREIGQQARVEMGEIRSGLYWSGFRRSKKEFDDLILRVGNSLPDSQIAVDEQDLVEIVGGYLFGNAEESSEQVGVDLHRRGVSVANSVLGHTVSKVRMSLEPTRRQRDMLKAAGLRHVVVAPGGDALFEAVLRSLPGLRERFPVAGDLRAATVDAMVDGFEEFSGLYTGADYWAEVDHMRLPGSFVRDSDGIVYRALAKAAGLTLTIRSGTEEGVVFGTGGEHSLMLLQRPSMSGHYYGTQEIPGNDDASAPQRGPRAPRRRLAVGEVVKAMDRLIRSRPSYTRRWLRHEVRKLGARGLDVELNGLIDRAEQLQVRGPSSDAEVIASAEEYLGRFPDGTVDDVVAYVVRRARYVSRQRAAGLVEQVVTARQPTEAQRALLERIGARHVPIAVGGDALFEAVLQSGTFLRQRFATATDLRAATANELRVNFEEYSEFYTGDDFWAEVEYIAQPGNPPRDGDGLVPRALARAAAIDLTVMDDFGVGGQGAAVGETGSETAVLLLRREVFGGHHLATRAVAVGEERGEPVEAAAEEPAMLSNWDATDDVIVEAIRREIGQQARVEMGEIRSALYWSGFRRSKKEFDDLILRVGNSLPDSQIAVDEQDLVEIVGGYLLDNAEEMGDQVRIDLRRRGVSIGDSTLGHAVSKVRMNLEPTIRQRDVLKAAGLQHVAVAPGGDALFEAVLRSLPVLRERFPTAGDLRAATVDAMVDGFEEFSRFYTGADYWAEVDHLRLPGNFVRDSDGIAYRALAKAAGITLSIKSGVEGEVVHGNGGEHPVMLLQRPGMDGHYHGSHEISVVDEPDEDGAGQLALELAIKEAVHEHLDQHPGDRHSLLRIANTLRPRFELNDARFRTLIVEAREAHVIRRGAPMANVEVEMHAGRYFADRPGIRVENVANGLNRMGAGRRRRALLRLIRRVKTGWVEKQKPTARQQEALRAAGMHAIEIPPGADNLYEAVLQSLPALRERFAAVYNLRAAAADELRDNFEEYSRFYTGADYWAEVDHIRQPGTYTRDSDGLVHRALAKVAGVDLTIVGDDTAGEGEVTYETGSRRFLVLLRREFSGGHYLATGEGPGAEALSAPSPGDGDQARHEAEAREERVREAVREHLDERPEDFGRFTRIETALLARGLGVNRRRIRILIHEVRDAEYEPVLSNDEIMALIGQEIANHPSVTTSAGLGRALRRRGVRFPEANFANLVEVVLLTWDEGQRSTQQQRAVLDEMGKFAIEMSPGGDNIFEATLRSHPVLRQRFPTARHLRAAAADAMQDHADEFSRFYTGDDYAAEVAHLRQPKSFPRDDDGLVPMAIAKAAGIKLTIVGEAGLNGPTVDFGLDDATPVVLLRRGLAGDHYLGTRDVHPVPAYAAAVHGLTHLELTQEEVESWVREAGAMSSSALVHNDLLGATPALLARVDRVLPTILDPVLRQQVRALVNDAVLITAVAPARTGGVGEAARVVRPISPRRLVQVLRDLAEHIERGLDPFRTAGSLVRYALYPVGRPLATRLAMLTTLNLNDAIRQNVLSDGLFYAVVANPAAAVEALFAGAGHEPRRFQAAGTSAAVDAALRDRVPMIVPMLHLGLAVASAVVEQLGGTSAAFRAHVDPLLGRTQTQQVLDRAGMAAQEFVRVRERVGQLSTADEQDPAAWKALVLRWSDAMQALASLDLTGDRLPVLLREADPERPQRGTPSGDRPQTTYLTALERALAPEAELAGRRFAAGILVSPQDPPVGLGDSLVTPEAQSAFWSWLAAQSGHLLGSPDGGVFVRAMRVGGVNLVVVGDPGRPVQYTVSMAEFVDWVRSRGVTVPRSLLATHTGN
ncbi:hypothetical protein [Lentzea sp. NPDC059081]|uniref:hypothetical protein n=1 Tax=Lentzea sp. NPDC059081 TaxID=3346719 RepID=UPI0036A298C8